MSKAKKIIIFIAVLDILAACVVGVMMYMHRGDQLELKSAKINVEYGESISLDAADYLKKSVDEDVVKETKVTYEKNPAEGEKYDKIGRYTVRLTYKKEVAKVRVSVVDTTKPKFNDINRFESIDGVELSWGEYIKATDLAEVEVQFDDSDVDINQAGEYTLVAIARDDSGNERKKDLTVVISDEPNNMTAYAIDVNEEAGTVIVTAIIRNQDGTYSRGTSGAGTQTNGTGGNNGQSSSQGGETNPGENTTPNETIPDETVPDETVPDETVPDIPTITETTGSEM